MEIAPPDPLEIVDEYRTRGILVFACFGGLGLWSLVQVVREGQELSAGLWLSLKMLISLGVAFFGFQNIFYRRTLRFTATALEVETRGLRAPRAEHLPYAELGGFEFKWLYSRLPATDPRLELRIVRPASSAVVDVLRQTRSESAEAFVARARPVVARTGLGVAVDESGLWSAG